MAYEKSERIQELKQKKLIEQNGCCAACGKSFKIGDFIELAHVIPQRKYLIKLYGESIIHHELNMKLTHAGRCNGAIQLSPNKTKLVEAHINKIKEAMENDQNN